MSQVPSIYGPRQRPMGLLGQADFEGGAIYPQTAIVEVGATPLTDSLEQTLGLTARVFGQVAAGAERQRAMDVADIEQRDKMALAEREVVIGEARKQARIRYADIQAGIEAGRIARQPGESYADFAARVAAGESQGMGDLYAQSFAETIGPQVAMFAQNVEEKRVAEAKAASVQTLADSATLAPDAEGVRTAIEAGSAMIGEEKSLRAIGLTALQAAAQSGDRARFEKVRQALGDKLVQEQGALEITLGERERAIANERRNQFINGLAGLNLSGAGFGEQLAYVGEGFARGEIDADDAERLTNGIESARLTQQKQVLEQADQTQKATNIDTLAAEAWQGSLSAGGLSTLSTEEFTFTLPSGKTQKVEGRELVGLVTAKAMQEIAGSAPDPATALQRQALWLGSNNVKYDRLASQLSAGTSQAITAYQTVSQDGQQNVDIPASVIDAYRTATVLRQTSQAVYEKHTTADDRVFYDSVRMGLELGKTEQQAIADAAKAANHPLRFQPIDLTKTGLYNPIRNTSAVLAVNGSEVESRAYEVVRYLINSQGVRVDAALKTVAAQVKSQYLVHRKIAVNTAGMPENVKEALPDILDQKVDEYYAKFGEADDVDKSDVALIRDANTGNWRFVNNMDGSVLFSSNRMVVNDDIIDKIIRERAQAEMKAAIETGKRETMEVWNLRRNPAMHRKYGPDAAHSWSPRE